MKKTLLFALAMIALPLTGCAEEEVVDQATPVTDAPVVEEPAVIDPALEGEMMEETTDETLMEETAPMEGEVAPETPVQDGVEM